MAHLRFAHNFAELVPEEGRTEVELNASIIRLCHLVLYYVRDAGKQSAVFFVNLFAPNFGVVGGAAGPRPLILIKKHFLRLLLKCFD